MSAKAMDRAAEVLADPLAYTDGQRLYAALGHLRRHAPVSWVDVPNYRPFWAITKHADILAIQRDSAQFINSPRPFLATRQTEPFVLSGRSLIHLDEPEHGPLRAIVTDWFRPKAMRALKDRIDELSKTYIDKMFAAGPDADFVELVAADYPLAVMMSLLGLPDSAAPCLKRLTREMFSPDDNESPSDAGGGDQVPAIAEAFDYFTAVITSRREQPTEDLASAIANARIDGKPLEFIEMLSYFLLFTTAGHDTTSSAISGGLLALIENPDQLTRLRTDPGLVGTATEEVIRWVSPTKQFMRTAVEDTVVRGERIAAGESVLLSYVSANRDEDVFAEPDSFIIRRDPNKHLAFGHGAHYCLGATMARMEISSMLAELIPRLKSIELNGEPQLYPAIWSGGLKHLPIRYSTAPCPT